MRIFYRKLVINNWTIYFIIPIILFLFGAVNTLLLVSPLSFSLLTYTQKPEIIHISTNNLLLEGENFTERITAKENNLGIIAISFFNPNTIAYSDEDQLAFTIKDVAVNKIVYKNSYRSGLLTSLKYFPFGFPKIADSKNKQYQISIVSLKGNTNNALRIDNNAFINQVSYDYSKSEIIGSPTKFLSFIAKKVALIFNDNQIMFITLEYFIPLLFYCSFLILNRRGKTNPYIAEVVLLSIILYDIFLIVPLYTLVLFIILIIWIVLAIWDRLDSSVSYLFACILFIIALVIQSVQFISIANKASVWAFFFLVIGTVQFLKELSGKEKKRINMIEFIQHLR
ncbi:MAG: hypothetical protein ACR2LN_06890 [Candidatus Levyibacteriota bacterium]